MLNNNLIEPLSFYELSHKFCAFVLEAEIKFYFLTSFDG
jgi:hypothetical protein